jgi:hypothetical protein
MGPDVFDKKQTLTGIARDNVGVAGVQIEIEDGQTYAILGADIADDGKFGVEITLPKLGANKIKAKAKDLADLESDEASLSLNLADKGKPIVALVEATDGTTTVSPPSPLILYKKRVKATGTVTDRLRSRRIVGNSRAKRSGGAAVRTIPN